MVDAVTAVPGFSTFSMLLAQAKEREERKKGHAHKYATMQSVVPLIPAPSSIVEISQEARALLDAEHITRVTWDWEI